jgi:transcriptional regulator with XRE-family HTH domain
MIKNFDGEKNKKDQRHEQLRKQIGSRIKRRREATGYTQDMVAERLSLGTAAYARYEQGVAEPSIARLSDMADIFECGLDELIMDTSTRVEDQAQRILLALQEVSVYDRESVMQVIEQVCKIAWNKSRTRKLPADLSKKV